MNNPAVIIRPQSVRTSKWIRSQIEAIRQGTGRRIGAGALVESVCNALVESHVDFSGCHGMSDVASHLCSLLRIRSTGVR